MELTQAFLMQAVPAVVLLGLAVFVHEAGHFLMAKRKKVAVEKFSLGFGPRIAGFKKGGTEYRLSLIPLGGYVKMAGDDPGKGEGKPDEFFSKKPGDRISIVAAGPAMNILLAYVITVAVLWAIGIRVPIYDGTIGAPPATLAEQGFYTGDKIVAISGKPVGDWEDMTGILEGAAPGREKVEVRVERNGETISFSAVNAREMLKLSPFIPSEIGDVMAGTPAYSSGLKAGDKIISINGQPVKEWTLMQEIITGSAGEEIELKIARNGREFTVSLVPRDMLGDGRGMIGISAATPDHYMRRFGPPSLLYAFTANVRQVALSYRMLGLIIARPGKYRDFIGGPVMVMQMAGAEAGKGLSDYLSFMAAINIMLAIINLVPFPVLDGGHILFFLVEIIKGRPVSFKTQEITQKIGLLFLVLLMTFLVAQDSIRQLDRSRVLRMQETGEEE